MRREKGRERPTIRQVAEQAGVSTAAVSRYLNGGPISEAKRALVSRAIEETGYRPSNAGKMLRTGRGNLIGVIVPRINSPSVSQVTAGIADVLHGSGYTMILGSCGEDVLREIEYLDVMQADHVAGIILMGTTLTPEHREAFSSCQVPLVVTGQNFPDMNCVYHDDFGAARDLTRRVLSRGRARIGYIGVDERDPAAGLARRQGVEAALQESGLELAASRSVTGGFHPENGVEGVRRLLDLDPGIDAVICATDMIALGAMSELKARGYSVPGQVAVAGFGDSWAGTIVEPGLTTVHLPQKSCGAEAADMLIRLIGEPAAACCQKKMTYHIVERASI